MLKSGKSVAAMNKKGCTLVTDTMLAASLQMGLDQSRQSMIDDDEGIKDYLEAIDIPVQVVVTCDDTQTIRVYQVSPDQTELVCMFNLKQLLEANTGAKVEFEIVSMDMSLAEGVIVILTSTNQIYVLNSKFNIHEIKFASKSKADNNIDQ